MSVYAYDRLFIGGDWVAPAGSDTLEVISPHTEEVVGRAPGAGAKDVDRAVEAARTAFDHGPWPRTDPAGRAATVARLPDAFGQRTGELADLITAEMGRPITASRIGQVGEAEAIWRYYAGLGTDFPWEERRTHTVTVRREPAGVVAAIAPWNGPQLVIAGNLAAALVAGCTVVVKPAPETPLDCYVLAERVREAGFPPGVVNIVAGGPGTGQHPGSVWTADTARGLNIARRVRTGTYGVSAYGVQECAPFGGYKCSGVGRELGPEGLATYVEYKSIVAA